MGQPSHLLVHLHRTLIGAPQLVSSSLSDFAFSSEPPITILCFTVSFSVIAKAFVLSLKLMCDRSELSSSKSELFLRVPAPCTADSPR